MKTTKMTIINLDDGDQLKVWLNGVEILLRAGANPAITLKRFKGLRVLPGHFEGELEQVGRDVGELVFDQLDVIPVAIRSG